jgi:hypothetical protein
MALRWFAAGMLEADHQFRRVNGPSAPAETPRRARRDFKNVSGAGQNGLQAAG